MEPLLACSLFALAVVGSSAFWITFLNRTHGLGVWRPLVHGCSGLALLGFLGGPLVLLVAALAASPAIAAYLPTSIISLLAHATGSWAAVAAQSYALACLLVALGPFPWWIVSRRLRRDPAQLRSLRIESFDFARQRSGQSLAHGFSRFAVQLPGNEVFQVEVNLKTLALAQLPPRLEGLSISHLSDLHMSGRISIDFFHEMVDRTNALSPDLVAITGDIVDASKCLDWIVPTLSRLNAPLGVYGVLGNHDVCVDLETLRTKLAAAGVTNLGGRTRRLEVAGETIVLTGNELPWIPPTTDASEQSGTNEPADALRILLSHSPDQIGWARRRRYDLMLAGHTHGGQIQFPFFGAVLAPSIFGTRYASGLFYEAPTLMHVSRGVSGLTPVRYNCRPEIALLRLVGSNTMPCSNDATPDTEEAMATGS
ncbi:MAG TPA: metallophosphoesterase [Pirellulales bacterium]|jgi:hypothetical protein